jgi:hypothetical protein
MSSFLSRIITSRKKSPSKAQTSTMKNIFKRSLANFRQSRARIEDVAIELSTPRSTTQISATPRSATQISATPRSATPRTATQISATPRSATQISATPRSATPRSATQISATPRSATPRSATPISATPRSATQISATQISATPRSTTPRSNAPRSTTPSVRRPVQQEALNKLNTTYGESTALQTLNLKKSNTQDKILKKSAQILKLEQKFRDAKKKAEKDEFARQIKILKELKLALKQELVEITIELQSAMETMQKYSKKGGTRKRRKYAKKY